MEEILACRACLATDVKLFNMYTYRLVTAFEILTNTEMSTTDGLPNHLCSFCSALLLKCTGFQDRCRTSQLLLKSAILKQNLVTTDYIRNIDRKTRNLSLPYTVEHIIHRIKPEYIIKDEINTIDNEEIEEQQIKLDEQLKFEENSSTSDEEPFSNKIVIKIPNITKKREQLKNEETSISMEIKEEIEENDEFDFIDDNFDTFDDDEQNLENSELGDQFDIIKLTKREQVEEVQLRKKSLNYLKSIYKCDKCYKGFMIEGPFRNHMSSHDPASGAYACDVCAMRRQSAGLVRKHALVAHARKYVCKRCNYVGKSSAQAKEHCKWHDGFVYECSICGATFGKSTSYLSHVRIQHPSEYSCDICGESFIGSHGLNLHKKKAHSGTQSEKVKSQSQCAVCGVLFKSVEALDTHVASSKNHVCDPSLKSCAVCGSNCSDEESLMEHMKSHRHSYSVQCVECDHKFSSSRTYADHYQQVHMGVAGGTGQGIVCEMCGKTFRCKAMLMYHQRTHTGEKPYQCTECPKRFTIHYRLLIHQRTHTGERPFQCAHCPKAFKLKAALNRHDRIHTGAKPYACAHCGRAFNQSDSMKLHVRTVHLKQPAPYRHRKTKKK